MTGICHGKVIDPRRTHERLQPKKKKSVSKQVAIRRNSRKSRKKNLWIRYAINIAMYSTRKGESIIASMFKTFLRCKYMLKHLCIYPSTYICPFAKSTCIVVYMWLSRYKSNHPFNIRITNIKKRWICAVQQLIAKISLPEQININTFFGLLLGMIKRTTLHEHQYLAVDQIKSSARKQIHQFSEPNDAINPIQP